MELTNTAQKFILHWGEMGTRWGINRSVAQIHALLFYVGRPLPADEIADTLGVARSNVSNSIKELQNWKLLKTVHLMGDRRDHFETSVDVWALFKTIVQERKEREFDPTITVLRDCVASPEFKSEGPAAQQRVKDSLVFMEALSTWTEEMLRLDTNTLTKVMKLGAKIQKFVRG